MRIKLKPFNKLRNLFRSSAAQPESLELQVGAIVYRKTRGNLAILLFQDKRSSWSIPKSRRGETETETQSIMRIIREKVGPLELKVWQTLGHVSLRSKLAGRPDRLQLFLIQALPSASDPTTESPAKGVLWLPLNEALKKIDYEEVAKMVNLAAAKLKRAQV